MKWFYLRINSGYLKSSKLSLCIVHDIRKANAGIMYSLQNRGQKEESSSTRRLLASKVTTHQPCSNF